ncbi:MAG: RluA family pseudouridine synthase [Planctomycetaceae bacterium]
MNLAEQLRLRNDRLQRVVHPLPGSRPYFNIRPLNVPLRYDGFSLIDMLTDWHPQVTRQEWLRKIHEGRIVSAECSGHPRRQQSTGAETLPLSPDLRVRAGERLQHLQPGTVEPAVNADLRIIFEDEQFIVVSKPAPLPLHASGRFHRNTVEWILRAAYAPEVPRIVHRLDANTSGVLVLCRTQEAARAIGGQFERRNVRKTYLARVMGVPSDQAFECDAKISAVAGAHGLRLIDPDHGQHAVTQFSVREKFSDGTTLLEIRPLTGRTNQIRLHLWHLSLPILGDPAYLPGNRSGTNVTLPISAPPMCLHASKIELQAPPGLPATFQVPDPFWASEPDAPLSQSTDS